MATRVRSDLVIRVVGCGSTRTWDEDGFISGIMKGGSDSTSTKNDVMSYLIAATSGIGYSSISTPHLTFCGVRRRHCSQDLISTDLRGELASVSGRAWKPNSGDMVLTRDARIGSELVRIQAFSPHAYHTVLGTNSASPIEIHLPTIPVTKGALCSSTP